MINLPIDSQLDEIVATVRTHQTVVLTATPGAGKTTRLPPELLRAVRGKIVILEPRRMAAVSACARVCDERGWTLGQDAGYQVRFESKVTRDTRLIFMTDALLLRQMIDEPELPGVELVVIDEFHERNLNQDLILGAIKELQDLGAPIKLLVMSATLELDRLRNYLPDSALIGIPGKVHPLEVQHSSQPLSAQTDFAFIERVAQAVVGLTRQGRGDLLVFLPGTGEIRRVGERLEGRTEREITALHGQLSLAEQQRVLKPSSKPRVILSTNIAEASVTVDGVDTVLDTGLAKVLETNAQTGFSALETRRIALFNARQRAGRAARQRAGVCLRLWTPHEEVTQAEAPRADVERVDLSSALLWLAKLGVRDVTKFAWFTHPPDALLRLAQRTLRELGAVDRDGRLSARGEQLVRYPLPPRLGALLSEGAAQGLGTTAARVAALLNERDFADRAETHANTECDVLFRLDLLNEVERGLKPGGIDPKGAREVLESARQLARLTEPGNAADDDVRGLLLKTNADRLARRRGTSERALMVGGRGVRLSPRSQVRLSEFFVALDGMDLPGQADTSIRLASGFTKAFVLQQLADEIEVQEDAYFDEDKEQFYARRVRVFRGLPLDEPTLTQARPEALGSAMVDALVPRWTWFTSKHERLASWLNRFYFLARHRPALTDELTPAKQREFLELATFGATKLGEIFARDLVAILESVLAGELTRALAAEVPAVFVAPSGATHPIVYEDHGAFVEVRLQEMFGMLQTPRIVFGQVPLTFRLLSPGFKPVQVTADLAGFWRSAYFEVRKELRLRYPKHAWPEDPLTARPEAKGRRRT